MRNAPTSPAEKIVSPRLIKINELPQINVKASSNIQAIVRFLEEVVAIILAQYSIEIEILFHPISQIVLDAPLTRLAICDKV